MTPLHYSVKTIAGLRRVVACFGMLRFTRRHTDALDAPLPPSATVTDALANVEAFRIEVALETVPGRLGLCDDWFRNNRPLIARFLRNRRLQTLAAEVDWRLSQLHIALRDDIAAGPDPVYIERAQARCDQLERELAAALARGGSKGKPRPEKRKFTDAALANKWAGTEAHPGKTDRVARSLKASPSTVRRRLPAATKTRTT